MFFCMISLSLAPLSNDFSIPAWNLKANHDIKNIVGINPKRPKNTAL